MIELLINATVVLDVTICLICLFHSWIQRTAATSTRVGKKHSQRKSTWVIKNFVS